MTVSVQDDTVRSRSFPLIAGRSGRSGRPAESPRAAYGRPVHPPTAGAVAQLAVLALLGAGVGLGVAGWVAGAVYTVAAWVLLSLALNRSGVRRWGPADSITLIRATLVGGVTALVADSLFGAVPVAALVTLAAVALALDAVDGQVARRTGTVSRLGARFDMETDSVLVLVLGVYVAQSLGWWALAIGLFRYAFGVAGWALPWLRAPLEPRIWRKVVAALQGIVLVVASAGLLPGWASTALVGTALAVLSYSFGRDIRTLWRARAANARQAGAGGNDLGPGLAGEQFASRGAGRTR